MLAVDPSTRLSDVTFCVLDLETTGTSDEQDEIVEVGAILVRGGERLGTLQTLICHRAVAGPSHLPRIESVLVSLLEFMRGSIIVGHNIRFDLRFLNAAFWKSGRDIVLDPLLAVDTVPLARRLLRDDADDCRLGTLAQRFSFETQPTHRAFADAAATVELLHLLIERATHYGAIDLDDLMRLPNLMRHRHRAKLSVTAALPRQPGAACLRDRSGAVLHHVVADDLRHAVRSLFDQDVVQPVSVPASVLQHVHSIDVVAGGHPLVTHLAALRWAAAQASATRTDAVYLQRTGPNGDRLKAVADRRLPDLVAGPMPRVSARNAITALARHGHGSTELFVLALSAGHDLFDDPLLDDLVVRQRALAAARSIAGPVHAQGAEVSVSGGRVRDVVVEGRSWADRLPAVCDVDRPEWLPSPGHAIEATLVAQLPDQPDCWMRDAWSPQY
jgi:DNA polymerase III epsilon subunit-like protein